MTCSIEDCQKPKLARGWCSAHWWRWRKHGDPLITLNPNYGKGRDPIAKARARARYREKKRDELRAKGRAYSKANRQRSNERRRADKAANPDKYRFATRRYTETHREQAIERAARWREANRDRARMNVKRRRQRLGGGRHRLRPGEWDSLLAQQSHRCFYCYAVKKLEQDHIIPLSRGGIHDVGNIVAACRSCNSTKNNWLLSEIGWWC